MLSSFIQDVSAGLPVEQKVSLDPATGTLIRTILEGLLRYIESCIDDDDPGETLMQLARVSKKRGRRGRVARSTFRHSAVRTVGRKNYREHGGSQIRESIVKACESRSTEDLSVIYEELSM